jgi:hypothetical protein
MAESNKDRRNLIQQQDAEYEALLKSTSQDDGKDLDLERALALSTAEAELVEELRFQEVLEVIKKLEAPAPPALIHSLSDRDKYNPKDIFQLKFKLPAIIKEYSFHRKELMVNVEKQIIFDLQTKKKLQFLIPVRHKLIYNKNMTLEEAGIKNKTIVIVEEMED